MPDLPGPGDPATWPAYTGHPNDPRNPGDDEWPRPPCYVCGGDAWWRVEADARCNADNDLCHGCAPRYVGGLLEVANGPDELIIRALTAEDADWPEPDYEAMAEARGWR